MSKKFEIKAHDGAGRLGKLDGKITPSAIDTSIFKIADSQGSAYNIDEKIAMWNVRETISKSIKDKDADIGVIQGSKYIDLRLECCKTLEDNGYNGFIIANGDELLLHPKNLVEMIVKIRQNIKPTSYLILPFSECSFIPLLCYMGIDGFLVDSTDYYSYLNVLMTPTKNYDLDTYKIYENMTKEEIAKYNMTSLDLVLREVREHMKNRSLRNLVEERAATSPQNMSALKILDKKYPEYILKHNQLY